MGSASQKNGPANGAKIVRSVFLSYPVRTDTSVIRRVLEGEGVGVRSDEDMEPGDNLRASLIEGMLVSIIATAIRESGVDTQASVRHRTSAEGVTADIAVWSDELESLIGNPLPIEVRSSLMTVRDAEGAANNLTRAIVGAKVRWGLILFLKATADVMGVLSKHPVLAMSIEDFLEGLRKRSFGRIVADLRNRTVHGARADASSTRRASRRSTS